MEPHLLDNHFLSQRPFIHTDVYLKIKVLNDHSAVVVVIDVNFEMKNISMN